MYPPQSVAIARTMRSMFPGNFPFTLHGISMSRHHGTNWRGGETYTGMDPTGLPFPLAEFLAFLSS